MKRLLSRLALAAAAAATFLIGGKAFAQEQPNTASAHRITETQVQNLIEAKDNVTELNALMQRFALPGKSIVLVMRSGAVVCPVDFNQSRVNLLFIDIRSSHVSGEPAQICEDWTNALQQNSTLDQIDEATRNASDEERQQITATMIRWIATSRLRMSNAHYDVLMLNTRSRVQTGSFTPGITSEFTLPTSEGIRPLTREQVQKLQASSTSNDPQQWKELMSSLSLPQYSAIFVNNSGGIVCPVDHHETHVNLLIFAINSSAISKDLSESCRTAVQMLIDTDTLNRAQGYLIRLGRTDSADILRSLVQWVAADRYGIRPADLRALLAQYDATDASAQEQLQILQRHQLEQSQAKATAGRKASRTPPFNH